MLHMSSLTAYFPRPWWPLTAPRRDLGPLWEMTALPSFGTPKPRAKRRSRRSWPSKWRREESKSEEVARPSHKCSYLPAVCYRFLSCFQAICWSQWSSGEERAGGFIVTGLWGRGLLRHWLGPTMPVLASVRDIQPGYTCMSYFSKGICDLDLATV